MNKAQYKTMRALKMARVKQNYIVKKLREVKILGGAYEKEFYRNAGILEGIDLGMVALREFVAAENKGAHES